MLVVITLLLLSSNSIFQVADQVQERLVVAQMVCHQNVLL